MKAENYFLLAWIGAPRFGVRRLVAAYIAGATCRSGRAAQSGSSDNQYAPCFRLLRDHLFLRVAPLNAVLLERQVVQAGKAATSRRTPYFRHVTLQENHPQYFQHAN